MCAWKAGEREREIPKKRDRDTREFLEYTEWISNRNGQKLYLITFNLLMVLMMKRKILIHKKTLRMIMCVCC